MTENQKNLYEEFCKKLSFLERIGCISQSHDYGDIPAIYGVLDGKKRQLIYELSQMIPLLQKEGLEESAIAVIDRFQNMNLCKTDMTLQDLINLSTSVEEKEFFERCGYPINGFVPEFSMLRMIGSVINT